MRTASLVYDPNTITPLVTWPSTDGD